jgi:hypothetical protein
MLVGTSKVLEERADSFCGLIINCHMMVGEDRRNAVFLLPAPAFHIRPR